MRILMAIASSDDGLSVKAVADQFELSRPTAYHLLNTLVHEGALLKDQRRRYTLGPAAAVIAEAHNRRNVISARHLQGLHALANASGETAYLSGWRNGAITVLATVEGSHAVRVAGLSTGYSDNVHARASGKLLLAFAPPAVREPLLERLVLRKVTEHTITSRAALRRELDYIAASGLSYDHQEFREGVECISAPIRDNGAVVACFTLACPKDRFVSTEPQLVDALLRATADASTS